MQKIHISKQNLLSKEELCYFRQTIQECLAEAEEVQIPFRFISAFFVNAETTTRWGQCSVYEDHCLIEINRCLLQPSVPRRALKEILLHEICHAAPSCEKHIGTWKTYTNRLNQRFGYHIKGIVSSQDLGLPISFVIGKARYPLYCSCCGMRYDRERLSRLVQHPEEYQCSRCGGEIVRSA